MRPVMLNHIPAPTASPVHVLVRWIFAMSQTDVVFARVAELKYPDHKLPSLRSACKCELYQRLVTRIEDGQLFDDDLTDVVTLVAVGMLSGAGGVAWSPDDSVAAVKAIMVDCFGVPA